MREPVDVPGPENKAPAQLERISPRFMLPQPGGSCPAAGNRIVAPQQVQKIRAFQLRCPVRFAMLVDEKREINAGFLTKSPGVPAVAQPDRCQSGAPGLECLLMPAQLRDVFTAENSAVVAQEYNNRGLLFPN